CQGFLPSRCLGPLRLNGLGISDSMVLRNFKTLPVRFLNASDLNLRDFTRYWRRVLGNRMALRLNERLASVLLIKEGYLTERILYNLSICLCAGVKLRTTSALWLSVN